MMQTAMSQLDLEYLQMLRDIKPYITCIMNNHYIGLIKLWLEKLGGEDFADLKVRNLHLQRLVEQIKSGILREPFIEAPPSGCLPADLTVYCTEEESLGEMEEVEEEDVSEEVEKIEEEVSLGEEEKSIVKRRRDSPTGKVINNRGGGDESSWMDFSEDQAEDRTDCDGDNDDNKMSKMLSVIEDLRSGKEELVKIVGKNQCSDDSISEKEYCCISEDKFLQLKTLLSKALTKNVAIQSKLIKQQDTKLVLRNLHKKHEENLRALKNSHEKQMSEKMATHAKNMTEVMASHEDRFAKERQTLEENWRKSFENEIMLIKNDYDRKIEDLIVKHETAMQEKVQRCNDMQRQYEQMRLEFEVKTSRDVENFYEKQCQQEVNNLKDKHKLQMEEINSEHCKEIQFKNAEIERLETLLKQQCARMQDEVTKIRSELETSNEQASKEKIQYMRRCIVKLDKLYRKAEKEFHRQLNQMRQQSELMVKQRQIMISSQKVQNISSQYSTRQQEIDDIIAKLEEKYKSILMEHHADTLLEKRSHVKLLSTFQNEIERLKEKYS